MNPQIKILIAEHNEEDLALLEEVLSKGGIDYEARIVQNEADYCTALKYFIPDIIISEFIFPLFDGPTAYKLKMELAAQTPFIFVCGEIGEENCVGYIDNGVTDYILKDRMFSLPAKIKRALKETTIRKQKETFENELLKSEARLIEAQALSKVGSWETDLSTWKVIWSAETYHIFGIEPGKFVASHPGFLAFVHPDDLTNVNAVFTASFTNSSINKLEHRIITLNGYEKIVEERWQIIFNNQGLPLRAVGTCQDITERKKNEAALIKAYVEKNMVLESIDDGFFALDENSIVTYWNKRAEILLGSNKENMIGKNLHEVFQVRGSSIFYENYLKALTEKITISFEGYSNLSKKWFAVSAYGSEKGLSVYFKDVTARKNDEEKIKESELRYRSLIEHASDAICIIDTNMKFIEINSMGCQQSGYTREEVLQLSVMDMLFEEELKTNPLKIFSLTPGKTFLYERRLKNKEGTGLEMELSGKMLEDGKVLIFIRDIAERKKAAQLINESEAKYRAFFENSMDGILLTIPDGAILAANSAACEIFQMTEAEICTAGRTGLVDSSDPRVISLINERQSTGRARGEIPFIRKDGSRFPGEISSVLFKDANGQERTSMIIRDISEQKMAESNLLQTSSKLQHTLADLNNIMDASLDIICSIDEEGRFVNVSAATETIWGYPSRELIGRKFINFVFKDDVEITLKAEERIRSGISETIFENRYINKNGNIVPMLWSAKWDEKDQLTYCIAKDASEKKRLEKAFEIERQRFQDLYSQAPSCMGILKGPDHVFEIANPLFLKLISKKDIIGKPVKEVLPELVEQGFFEILDQVYKNGETFSANEMLVQFDVHGTGKLVDTYLNFIYQAHRNAEGAIDGILFFAIDVTEQVLSRNKIEESEKRYRQIVETAQEGIWVIDENNKTSFVNNKMCEILEYTEAEMIGKDIHFFMDEDGKKIVADLKEMKRDGHFIQDHFKYISKSGNEIWTNISANPLFDEKGINKGSLAMVTDITQSKKAERRDQFQATLLNTIGQATIATDMQGKIIFWNKAASAIYGWTEEEVLGRNIIEITPVKQTKDQADQIMQELLLGNTWSGEFIVKRKDSTEFPAFVTNSPVYDQQGQLFGIIGVSYDITSRKQAELLLKESNERYNLISKATNDMVWDWDMVTGKVYRNKEGWKKIFRTGDKEIEIESTDEWDSRVHPEDKDKIKIAIDEVLRSSKDFYEMECRVLRNDGTYAFIHDRGTIFRNKQGKAIRIIGASQDITERKTAEAALLFTLSEKNTILESIGDAFFAIDENWIVNYWNNHAEKMLGVAKEKIVGQYLWDVFKDSIDSTSYRKYHEAISTNKSIQFEDFYPPMGKWYEISAYPSESGLAVYFKDITDRKHAEIKLNELNANLQVQAKELAVTNTELEQFAYVASHDLQEPLRMVSSFLSLLATRYESIIDEKGKQYINFAVDGAERMRLIILNLLEFSRIGRTEDNLDVIDLNVMTRDIQMLFQKEIEDKKAIITIDPLPTIHSYSAPLRQVFQNLIGNALKYSRQNVPPKIHFSVTELKNEWQFAVTDNGIGISDEYFDKIFIIFQRLHNKNEFSGTGIGLALTKKIIEMQGGKIWLTSTEGKGSTFYFTINK